MALIAQNVQYACQRACLQKGKEFSIIFRHLYCHKAKYKLFFIDLQCLLKILRVSLAKTC